MNQYISGKKRLSFISIVYNINDKPHTYKVYLGIVKVIHVGWTIQEKGPLATLLSISISQQVKPNRLQYTCT